MECEAESVRSWASGPSVQFEQANNQASDVRISESGDLVLEASELYQRVEGIART